MANSVDPDEMACMSHLIWIHTNCIGTCFDLKPGLKWLNNLYDMFLLYKRKIKLGDSVRKVSYTRFVCVLGSNRSHLGRFLMMW